MIRQLSRAFVLAGVVAVVGLTGCDTKADKAATPPNSNAKPEGGPVGGADNSGNLPKPPPLPPPPPPPK
jgi:hypothetical protein